MTTKAASKDLSLKILSAFFRRDASYKGNTVSYKGVHERGTALKPFIYHINIEPCAEDFFTPAEKILDTIVFDM
ncbi:MAG: hypothetical protein AAF203_04635 [Pseudomonadota bacterium]